MLTTYPKEQSNDGAARQAVWVDLFNPTDEELAKARADYGIEIPSRQQLDEIESSSRLRADKDTITLSMPIASKGEDGSAMPTPVGFVLSPKLLVTVRYAQLHSLEPALARMKKDKAPTSTGMFATLVEAMVDYTADVLEQIAGDLNTISARIFQRSEIRRGSNARFNVTLKNALVHVGQTGDHLSHIRDSILGLQRIAPYALDKGDGWLGDDVKARLNTVAKDLQSLVDFVVHLTDKVQFLLDAVLGFINTQQNDIFKVLTIVSVVGIPPTLIASMYGMNFDTIHEYHWRYGYAYGLTLIFLSALFPTLWFKWRGWW